jgi:L-lactate dehydrogenase (cytochrome)
MIPRRLSKILSLDDFERAARRHLPRPIFGYVAGGVEDGWTLHDNAAAFREYGFIPRFLAGVDQRSMQTTLLGNTYALPFGIAPMGISALSAYRGDIVLAEAAARSNIPMILSGASLTRMEDVAAIGPTAWFQAYPPPDLAGMEKLVERTARSGFKTLVLTVDITVPPNRETMTRAGFASPLRPSLRLAWDGLTRPRWLFGTFLRTLLLQGMPHFENSFAHRDAPVLSRHAQRGFSGRAHLTWDYFRAMRRAWRGNLVIKGLLAAEDARIACDCGADGIIVSNHGGRQLDGAVSPLRVLPDVVAAAGNVPVMFDSGIRRGTDVLKAFALGARFTFVGRPFNYAASVGGAPGIDHAIRLLRDEINCDMALLGVDRMSDVTRDRLMRLRD